MTKQCIGAWLPGLETPAGKAPRYVQLYRRIQGAILDGSLKPGTRLPSTRTLAADLGVSRTTTELAFAQLDAEGYLERRVGDGTYVAALASEAPLRPPPRRGPAPAPRRTLSHRGGVIAGLSACHEPTVVRAFTGGLPALDEFPLET